MKTNETKVHYKMYKIGKKWAVAAIAVGTFSLASGYTLTSAHADDTAVTTEQTLPVSSAADVVEPATELTSSAVSVVDSSTVAEVEAPAAIETPQSTAPITASSAAPTTSVATSAAPKVAAANVIQKNNKNYTQVTRENFADYFNLNGSAQYDADSGIITITENKQNQVGNFSLKEKINMDEDFTLKGKVNIGNSKAVINKIADGIGFAFHEGNTTDIGEDGGNLGIGGLVGAIGFKLDTFHNVEQQPTNTGSKDSYGWAADPTNHTPYGAFAYTNKTPELINGRNVYWHMQMLIVLKIYNLTF
ncbi:lectin-like domain-containing protein [Paucilactobacillus sp. N302-9]